MRRIFGSSAVIGLAVCAGIGLSSRPASAQQTRNASPPARYKVTVLGLVHNGNIGCAMAVNDRGWTEVMDGDTPPGEENSQSAVLLDAHADLDFGRGRQAGLGTLGGNTWLGYGGLNDRGQAVGYSETLVPDPNGEDVCAFGTKRTCRPFLWERGHMTALPLLGGNNGEAFAINNRGQIAGFVQTSLTDSGCPPYQTTVGAIWDHGTIHPLLPLNRDPDAEANGINSRGLAVGYSGTCTLASSAVVWIHGDAVALPNLGVPGAIAWAMNDHGMIAGEALNPAGTVDATLWRRTGPQSFTVTDLHVLPGDAGAMATGINNRGQVVGSTWDASGNWSHAFIWQNGVMTDLNTLFPPGLNLRATMGNTINNRGQITGMAVVLSGPHTGEVYAFLATPVGEGVLAPASPSGR